MADLYLGSLNIEAIEKLKSKAYNNKNLNVAIWVNNDVDPNDDNENWKAISISHGNKKQGEDVVYLGNAKKYVSGDYILLLLERCV